MRDAAEGDSLVQLTVLWRDVVGGIAFRAYLFVLSAQLRFASAPAHFATGAGG